MWGWGCGGVRNTSFTPPPPKGTTDECAVQLTRLTTSSDMSTPVHTCPHLPPPIRAPLTNASFS